MFSLNNNHDCQIDIVKIVDQLYDSYEDNEIRVNDYIECKANFKNIKRIGFKGGNGDYPIISHKEVYQNFSLKKLSLDNYHFSFEYGYSYVGSIQGDKYPGCEKNFFPVDLFFLGIFQTHSDEVNENKNFLVRYIGAELEMGSKILVLAARNKYWVNIIDVKSSFSTYWNVLVKDIEEAYDLFLD